MDRSSFVLLSLCLVNLHFLFVYPCAICNISNTTDSHLEAWVLCIMFYVLCMSPLFTSIFRLALIGQGGAATPYQNKGAYMLVIGSDRDCIIHVVLYDHCYLAYF